MAHWISSKLKVAETFLQQIDQQAAESLGKNENPRSEELSSETPRKSTDVLPLKDQLKKKKKTTEINDALPKLRSDPHLSLTNGNSNNNREKKDVGASVQNVKPSMNPRKAGLSESDWTELLSVPSQPTPSAVSRTNGLSGVRGLQKDGRMQRNLDSNLSDLEGKRNKKNQYNGSKTSLKSNVVLKIKVDRGSTSGKRSDGEDSHVEDKMQRITSVELGSNDIPSEGSNLDKKDASPSSVVENKNEANEKGNGLSDTCADKGHFRFNYSAVDTVLQSTKEEDVVEMVSVTVDGVSDINKETHDGHSKFRSSNGRHDVPRVGQRSSALVKRDSASTSDGGSDSEIDSASTSDSESEREREERKRRRAQILAEKATAKALEAIRERENIVARLEGEKQSLEKILEERAKQQVQEASELQNTTMEMMEAVELEKQKHNNTRMEVLARLAKLETANADLARSLATAQWNLQVEINRVSELRRQIELKEASHEEIRRKISATHDTGNKFVSSKGVEFERQILETEYSFLTEKIGRLQEKAKTLEANIEIMVTESENPTEVEVELKRRLGLLTDNLIQKQAQVEALSSEKATLLFRIEAVSRLLDENRPMLNVGDFPGTSTRDDTTGIWEFSNSKLKPMVRERIQSGQKHLGSLIRQLDSIFCAGAVFLRRNSTARLWSVIYLVCLHLWVGYILMSHSPVSDEARSGAVFSLENINNTGGA